MKENATFIFIPTSQDNAKVEVFVAQNIGIAIWGFKRKKELTIQQTLALLIEQYEEIMVIDVTGEHETIIPVSSLLFKFIIPVDLYEPTNKIPAEAEYFGVREDALGEAGLSGSKAGRAVVQSIQKQGDSSEQRYKLEILIKGQKVFCIGYNFKTLEGYILNQLVDKQITEKRFQSLGNSEIALDVGNITFYRESAAGIFEEVLLREDIDEFRKRGEGVCSEHQIVEAWVDQLRRLLRLGRKRY